MGIHEKCFHEMLPLSTHNICFHAEIKIVIPVVKPASVAQLDVHPTGDQKVAGSTPAKVGNILSRNLIVK